MKRARGAALLAAMLTVMLVATFAAGALWQQWRAVEVESAERQRIQSAWLLTGALDWARLILREDRPAADHFGEPWAVPLQEARLTTFLAADPNNTLEVGDADNVFLSGAITDLQGRFNIASVVEAGSVKEARVETLRRLFEVLGLSQSQLGPLVANLRFALDISADNLNAARAPLPPTRVEQLVWLGLPADTVAALEPYVTILPLSSTPVNLNTAPAEVVYAAGRGFSLADAHGLVAQRERQHFRNLADVREHLPEGASFPDGGVSFNTQFFEVRGRLRVEGVVIEERSMVQRVGRNIVTVQRERGGFEAFAGTPSRR